MFGVQVALKIVRVFDRCSTRIAASRGSPRAVRTAAASRTAFAITSRTAACGVGFQTRGDAVGDEPVEVERGSARRPRRRARPGRPRTSRSTGAPVAAIRNFRREVSQPFRALSSIVSSVRDGYR